MTVIPSIVMISEQELKQIKEIQGKILEKLESLQPRETQDSGYISAIEFMNSVRIKRSKFDHLVATNQIKTLKKARKIYVPTSEISKFFTDPNIK
jgi:fumarylacetoacetate (FAA) hydrolase family protein